MILRAAVATLLVVSGCALHANVPAESLARAPGADGECTHLPDRLRGTFRHARNGFYAALGEPRHRGVDMIAMEGDENQTLGGKLAYTAADKDVSDEEVKLFVCLERNWRVLGNEYTDGDGRFEHTLSGTRRLPAGMHDLLAYVPGDGSSIRFLAYIAAAGAEVIVTDVDGTITESEDAIFNTVVFGDDIAHQPGAPQVLAASKRAVVYVSARGDQLTEVTRLWLRIHGFPRGPLRLARAPVTRPGKRTVAFKTSALRELRIPIAAALGNRATDIEAYANAGLAPDRIFINLPEFGDEVRAQLVARRATPFDHYRDLATLLP